MTWNEAAIFIWCVTAPGGQEYSLQTGVKDDSKMELKETNLHPAQYKAFPFELYLIL